MSLDGSGPATNESSVGYGDVAQQSILKGRLRIEFGGLNPDVHHTRGRNGIRNTMINRRPWYFKEPPPQRKFSRCDQTGRRSHPQLSRGSPSSQACKLDSPIESSFDGGQLQTKSPDSAAWSPAVQRTVVEKRPFMITAWWKENRWPCTKPPQFFKKIATSGQQT